MGRPRCALVPQSPRREASPGADRTVRRGGFALPVQVCALIMGVESKVSKDAEQREVPRRGASHEGVSVPQCFGQWIS